jgi:hypothetical protein
MSCCFKNPGEILLFAEICRGFSTRYLLVPQRSLLLQFVTKVDSNLFQSIRSISPQQSASAEVSCNIIIVVQNK